MRGCRNGVQRHREAADAIAGPVPRPSERSDLAVNARLTREREPGPRATRSALGDQNLLEVRAPGARVSFARASARASLARDTREQPGRPQTRLPVRAPA